MPRLIGLSIVLLLHGALLWALGQHRWLPSPPAAKTLFVDFVLPRAPEKPAPPVVKASEPQPKASPAPRLAAVTATVRPTDEMVPPPEPTRIEVPHFVDAPQSEASATLADPPALPMPLPAEPVDLGSELAVACPERSAPVYPALSRRFGEEGMVVLRVELDETGAVAHARIQISSGFPRLDDAALSAVKTWRCQPAQRNGQPVRAAALQPFKFVLQ